MNRSFLHPLWIVLVSLLCFAHAGARADSLPVPLRVEFAEADLRKHLPRDGEYLVPQKQVGGNFVVVALGQALQLRPVEGGLMVHPQQDTRVGGRGVVFREGVVELNVGVAFKSGILSGTFGATIEARIDEKLRLILTATRLTEVDGNAVTNVLTFFASKQVILDTITLALLPVADGVTQELQKQVPPQFRDFPIDVIIQPGRLILARQGEARLAPQARVISEIRFWYKTEDGDKDGESGGAMIRGSVRHHAREVGHVDTDEKESRTWWQDGTTKGPFVLKLNRKERLTEFDLENITVSVSQHEIAPRKNPHWRMKYKVEVLFAGDPKPHVILDYDWAEHGFNFPTQDSNGNRYDLEHLSDQRSKQYTPYVKVRRPQ